MSTSLSSLVDNYLKFTTKSAEDVKKEKKSVCNYWTLK